MRISVLLLTFFFLPGLVAAAPLVPDRDFTLEVSVYNMKSFSSAETDYFSGLTRKNDSLMGYHTRYFFESRNSGYYNIIGTVLEVTDARGDFTYDFATQRGRYEHFGCCALAELDFTNGAAAYYSYFDTEEPQSLIEEAIFANTRVVITLESLPLPAGLPLLAAGLGLLGLLGWRSRISES